MTRLRTNQWGIVLGLAVGLGSGGCGGHTVVGHEPEATGGTGTGGTFSTGGTGTGGTFNTGGSPLGGGENCTSGDWGSISTPLEMPPGFPVAECSLGEVVLPRPCDDDVLRDGLVGTWLLCTSPSVFSTTDEVGLSISSDGTWAKVFLESGALVPATGFEQTGTWDVAGGGGQINFRIGAGGLPTHATFAKEPRKMRIGYTTMATYVWAGPSIN